MKRINQKKMILSIVSFAVSVFCLQIFISGNATAQIGMNYQWAWIQDNQEVRLLSDVQNFNPFRPFLGLQNPQTDDEWDDWDEDWDSAWNEGSGDRISAHVRYNRVEGLYLGARMKKDYWI